MLGSWALKLGMKDINKLNLRFFSTAAMSNSTNADNADNSANERRIHVRNLALMRSINVLKAQIDIVQERIRDISGAMVKVRDQLVKIDADLQSLADEAGELKQELRSIRDQHDLRLEDDDNESSDGQDTGHGYSGGPSSDSNESFE